MREINRRRFLESTAMLSAAAALHTGFAGASGSPKKAVLITMLPKELPYLERFKLALDAGFVEVRTEDSFGHEHGPLGQSAVE